MTEIMPVPRNSHITVLRPPSLWWAFFIGGDDGLRSLGYKYVAFDGGKRNKIEPFMPYRSESSYFTERFRPLLFA